MNLATFERHINCMITIVDRIKPFVLQHSPKNEKQPGVELLS